MAKRPVRFPVGRRRASVPPALADHLVVFVLVAAGSVDWLAGNVLHGILLIGVGVALEIRLLDPNVTLPIPDVDGEGYLRFESRHLVAALGAAITFAVIGGSFQRYTWPSTATVVVPGVAAVLVAWNEPDPDPPGRDGGAEWPWGALFVAVALFELTNFLLQPAPTVGSYAHPTISTIISPLLDSHGGRSAALLIWLLLGRYLVWD